MDLGRTSKIFNRVAEVGPEFVKSSFGEVGRKIFALFDSLGNHPEADRFFFDDSDLELGELFVLAQMAKEAGLDSFVGKLPAISELYCSDRLRGAKLPGNNGYASRLLRKPKKDFARSIRRQQRFGSRSFMFSASRNWHRIPSDFCNFRRGFPPETSEILTKSVRAFGEAGCPSLAEASSNFIRRYFIPPVSYGYKKLCVLDACIVLAKSMGMSLLESGGRPFVAARCPSGWFKYSPVVGPIHSFGAVPEFVSLHVEEAEFNPNLCFDSFFDHYLLVAPFLGGRLEGEFVGEVTFPDPQDCPKRVSEGSLGGVVLGERDGECYFLCEWKKVD